MIAVQPTTERPSRCATNYAKRCGAASHSPIISLYLILKDMQREKDSRKEHYVEGEQGEFHAAAIMHALLWIETRPPNSLLIS